MVWNILQYTRNTPPQLPEYGRSRIQSGEFVPSDSSVVCYRCIQYMELQQKLPAKDNAQVSLPSSSSPQAHQLTFDDVMDKGILIDDNLWFDCLQDSGFTETPKARKPRGKEQTAEQTAKNNNKKSNASKPTKPKHISFKMRLHPKLYTLAMEVVKAATSMDIPAFPRLPDIKSNNISKTYHYVGEWIAGNRKEYKRADIHNMGAGSDLVMDMINEEKYLSTEKFYILSQDDVFKHVFGKYGPKESTTSEYTVDDFVRVMGVIFNDELLRSYLPDMVGSTKNGNLNEIDGSRSGARVLGECGNDS